MNKKEQVIYDKAEEVCENIDLTFYPKLLLVSMVYCKIKNPIESTDKVCLDAILHVVPEQFNKDRKRKYLAVSPQKELNMLESELDKCDNLPEEIWSSGGMIVPKTVKYYAQKVIEMSDDDKE